MSDVLIGSNAFDPLGGELLDGWVTHLTDSAVYRRSIRQQPLRGTLDAAGEDTIPAAVPSSTSLVGRTAYLEAVILDPAQPNTIFTLSSVAVIEIRA